ncbi:MAG: hypothetical protein EOO90_21415 [Pedobacter sp.]|nr:MAG: hypothetical protein EOO90_21415 [Pedobacter sp.]
MDLYVKGNRDFSTIILLYLCVFFTACKKDRVENIGVFKGISKTSQGKVSSIFEFSSDNHPKEILYNATLPYLTGITTLKIKYQLNYVGKNLSSATIESGGIPVAVDFTVNVNGQITSAKFKGQRNDVMYNYDSGGRLVSSNGGATKFEYEYNAGGKLETIVLRNTQGIIRTKVTVTTDDHTNPLAGIPLVYLEEDIPMWTWFSLSKNNITSLIYTHYDTSGNTVETQKYIFSYTYDKEQRPQSLKRYTLIEYEKGDKGFFEAFNYNY